MSLFPCPECNNQVSSTALSCPHCGNILKDRRKQYLKIFCSAVLLFIAVFIFLFHGLFPARELFVIPLALCLAIWFYPQIKSFVRAAE